MADSSKSKHCGDPNRHAPHWHGAKNDVWCNGRKVYVNPSTGERGV